MKTKPYIKALLVVVPAVLLAFVLQPAGAVAATSVHVTYAVDGPGSVTPAYDANPEEVLISKSYSLYDLSTFIWAGEISGAVVVPTSDSEFEYWTADKTIYRAYLDNALYFMKPISAGTPLDSLLYDVLPREDGGSATEYSEYYFVTEDTTFTAHFKRTTPYVITYETDGNGTVNPTSEEVENAFDCPTGSTPVANENFEFSHWTANKEVVIGIEGAQTIAAGDPITTEQLKKVLVTDDITFTAHFKQTSVDPEPEPVNPDGGDTIKPADGANGKLTPKTGDTLPGAMAAVALGAGVVVAGVALLKKRGQQD